MSTAATTTTAAAAGAAAATLSTSASASAGTSISDKVPIGAAYLGSTPALLAEASRFEGQPGGSVPTVFNPATRAKRGVVQVPSLVKPWPHEGSGGRGKARKDSNGSSANGEKQETHPVYFEVHGQGPKKVVFVMGLNMSCFGWLPQVEHLTSNISRNGQKPKGDEYSVLVYDNRGYGNSGVPAGRYS